MVLDSSCECPRAEAEERQGRAGTILDLETQPLLPMHHLTAPVFHYGGFGNGGMRSR